MDSHGSTSVTIFLCLDFCWCFSVFSCFALNCQYQSVHIHLCSPAVYLQLIHSHLATPPTAQPFWHARTHTLKSCPCQLQPHSTDTLFPQSYIVRSSAVVFLLVFLILSAATLVFGFLLTLVFLIWFCSEFCILVYSFTDLCLMFHVSSLCLYISPVSGTLAKWWIQMHPGQERFQTRNL